jgi:hypothetical protein
MRYEPQEECHLPCSVRTSSQHAIFPKSYNRARKIVYPLQPFTARRKGEKRCSTSCSSGPSQAEKRCPKGADEQGRSESEKRTQIHRPKDAARTHGLYSKELLVSEVESPEFEEMRLGLEAQLQPSTTLRWLAFDYVVVCHWRCKLALRIERPQFARQFQDEQPENERGEAPDIDPVIECWYGSGRAATRAGILLLENAMEEFEANGAFREETKAFLTCGFGADFVRLLEEWKPMNRDAVLLADHLESQRKSFGEVSNTDVRTSSGLGETAKVVLDPMQCQQMVGKLLEERRNILNELLIIAERNMFEGKRGAVQSCDFNPRFLADANRELQRALDRYLFLKDRCL